MGENAAQRVLVVGAGRQHPHGGRYGRCGPGGQRAVVAQQRGRIDRCFGCPLLARGARRREGPAGRRGPACREVGRPEQRAAAAARIAVIAPIGRQGEHEAQPLCAVGGRRTQVEASVAEARVGGKRRGGLGLKAAQRAVEAPAEGRDTALELERPAASGLQPPGDVVVHAQQVHIELLPLRGALAHDVQLLRLREPQEIRRHGQRAASRAADVIEVVLHAVRRGFGLLAVGIAARCRGVEIAPRKVGRKAVHEVEAFGVGQQLHMGRELPVGKPGPLRELFSQFPVGEVADDPRGVVRSQPVVAPGDVAAQLVVVREFAQVVGTGHRRTIQPRAAVVERRLGESR